MLTQHSSTNPRTARIVVLGANGFVGRAVITAAVSNGVSVSGVVRKAEAAKTLEQLGAQSIIGDAVDATAWIAAAASADVIIDLVQPPVPRRLGARALQHMVKERMSATASVLAAMETLPPAKRPLYMNVSGLSDLAPDSQGLLSHQSALKTSPSGFGRIGVAVRGVIQAARVETTFVHLGTVYGAGKAFEKTILPAVKAGRYPVFGDGSNRMSFIHVNDAARALIHVATLSRAELVNQSWVLADRSELTLRTFLTETAEAVGGPRPKRAPRWLGHLILGSGLMEELSKHVPSDASRLEASGFAFEFPNYREGLIATLVELEQRAARTANQQRSLSRAVESVA